MAKQLQKQKGGFINQKKKLRNYGAVEGGKLLAVQVGLADPYNLQWRVDPNLIQDFTVDRINQLWVADITYIHILVCFVYLAVILDVYSKRPSAMRFHAISIRS